MEIGKVLSQQTRDKSKVTTNFRGREFKKAFYLYAAFTGCSRVSFVALFTLQNITL